MPPSFLPISPMSAQRIDFYLNASPGLLFARARQLIELQQVFVEIAPRQLAKLSRVGLLTQGALTLYADNGAVAAKLKQLMPRLLVNFQKQGLNITVIRVEVQVRRGPAAPAMSARKGPRISQTGLQSLSRLALRLPPSPLKTAVESMLLKCSGDKPDRS